MKSNQTAPRRMSLFQRYALIGAAIGLYFGLFYRPSREPDFVTAVLLGLLAALVTVAIRSWKQRPPFLKILRDFAVMGITFPAFLLALEFRHIVEAYGGRLAVTLMTTAICIGLGLFMAYGQRRSPAGDPAVGGKAKHP